MRETREGQVLSSAVAPSCARDAREEEGEPLCDEGALGPALVVLTCLGGAMLLLVGYMIAAAVVR